MVPAIDDPAGSAQGGSNVFYETAKNNHGLPFNPFKSCVVPRPIGWVSTREP